MVCLDWMKVVSADKIARMYRGSGSAMLLIHKKLLGPAYWKSRMP